MYAWEHAFSEEEVHAWIQKNLHRYQTDGYSYYAAILKGKGELIGVIGPLLERIGDNTHIGVGYILNKMFWGQGYALEGATASVRHACIHLNAENVIALIRPMNIRSRNVATRLGMKILGGCFRYYMGKEMPHYVYGISRKHFLQRFTVSEEITKASFRTKE